MEHGKMIKEYRKKNKMTQEQFGKIVGVNKQTVSKWENGLLKLSTKMAYEVSKATNIPLEMFVRDICEDGDTDRNYIYKEKNQLDIGLNSLFRSIHDFFSLGWFLDSFSNIWSLLDSQVDILGFLLVNLTIEDEMSHEKAIPINFVTWSFDTIVFDILGNTFVLTESDVSDVKAITSFNNEVYSIRIDMSGGEGDFWQLIFGLDNREMDDK